MKIGWGEGCKVSQSWEKLFFVFSSSQVWEMLPLPFLWLPKIGKCCRRRFASFPGLGRFADTVWEISQGWEHLLALSELFPNIGTDFLFLFNLFPKLGSNSLLSTYSLSHSSSHILAVASLGIRQSPRGLRLTLPTFGPSGRHERLNCWAKKRRRKTFSQCFISSSE